MCFCFGTLAGLGPSWINKYDNKPPVGWQQVLINDLLFDQIKRFVQTADSIETKPSETIWMESLTHSIRSKTDSFHGMNTVTVNYGKKQQHTCADKQKSTLLVQCI